MAKKLTIVEDFYVRNNPDGLSASELSKRLNKPLDAVQKVLDEVAEENKAKEEADKAKRRGDTHFRQVMGRTTGTGKKGKVAIMTQAASEVTDEMRKNAKKNNKNPSHIYKPYAE
jgi:ElaB/YqjD/DUF883 family membrane-anchored ribosome-binding protein